jgi:hypothetical protein
MGGNSIKIYIGNGKYYILIFSLDCGNIDEINKLMNWLKRHSIPVGELYNKREYWVKWKRFQFLIREKEK